MKASELIKQLQQDVAESGDLEVFLPAGEEFGAQPENPGDTQTPCVSVCTSMDQNDKPSHFLLCDESLTDAFT